MHYRCQPLPICAVLLLAVFDAQQFFSTTTADAFVVRPPGAPLTSSSPRALLLRRSQQSVVGLFMGKGLNKAKNKQGLLKQKMEEAKRQNLDTTENAETTAGTQKLTDREIRERNDRLRFEELLKKGSSSVLNDYSSDGYLNKQQEEEEIDAFRKCYQLRVSIKLCEVP